MKNIDSYIRKLAKNSYYQSLYNQSKEIGLNLFRNHTDYTAYQVTFLRYLAFYNCIYTDIALNEVDDSVLKHEIFEDAYIYWKNKTMGETPKEKDKGKDTPKKTTIFR